MVEKYSYGAFGTVTIRNAGDQILTTSGFGNCRMFTGREYDPETGNYYYRARYYKPSIGRFLQTDPIGYADSMNLYSYVGNNPVNWVDPYGLCKENEKVEQLKKELNDALKRFDWKRAKQITKKLAQELGVNVSVTGAGSYHGGGLGWSVSISADPSGNVKSSIGIGVGVGAGFSVAIGVGKGDAGSVHIGVTVAGGTGRWGGELSGKIGSGGLETSAAGGWGYSVGGAITIGGNFDLGNLW